MEELGKLGAFSENIRTKWTYFILRLKEFYHQIQRGKNLLILRSFVDSLIYPFNAH